MNSNCEDLENNNGCIMKLKDRRELLEASLAQKFAELKSLCVAEAELTGTLPIETPLGPNGTPPKFRRIIGTMFSFKDIDVPENLIKSQLVVNRKGRIRGSPLKCSLSCPSKKMREAKAEISTWPHRISPTKSRNYNS